MYKITKSINNNIKGDDIIKTLGNMVAFAGGVTLGLMYKKYERDITRYMKKATKAMDTTK